MLKILNIVGARPNFMKIAPLIRALDKEKNISKKLVHTGQHYDPGLSDIFFKELKIPAPDIHLEIGSLPREEQIAKISQAFLKILTVEKPDLVIVVGDVNSSIACARSAKENKIKVAHIEAGLRSFDLTMPEELNRIETDQISDFLYVTEESGMINLAQEKVPGKAKLVGNVMIDTLVDSLDQIKKSNILSQLNLKKKEYFISTFHRPSNVDTKESLRSLISKIKLICNNLPLVLPLHPRTKNSLTNFGLWEEFRGIKNLILIEPLGYNDFLSLVISAKAVLTDSGGIQEETTYLGVPCLTLRENTERPCTIELGTNVLIGNDENKLKVELDKIMQGNFKKSTCPPLWDGKAAERIVADLISEFN